MRFYRLFPLMPGLAVRAWGAYAWQLTLKTERGTFIALRVAVPSECTILKEDTMKIITDIQSIEKMAGEKEDQNWLFRCFVKASYMGAEELDAIVHKLYGEVSAQINCQTCGNCCRIMHPILRKKDIRRLASHLSVSEDTFEKQYLVKGDGEKITFRDT
ncbi:MAG: YkgJ family cysteine cluster protein, partial [Desulfobacterales bacterium]